jgi:two-component system invasion response regulator UvrY
MAMKFLIADDHLVVRKGLIQIIREEFPHVLIEEASSGTEALEKLGSQPYDMAILDITMPGINGLDVVRQAKTGGVTTPMLVLTSLPEDQYAVRVLRAGAHGFIGKEKAGEEITNAIRKILSGRKYIPENVSEQMARDLSSGPAKPPHESLSSRELEIMHLLASGKTVSRIAKDLSIAITTVSTYRLRVFDKMNFKNNADLMRYVISINPS